MQNGHTEPSGVQLASRTPEEPHTRDVMMETLPRPALIGLLALSLASGSCSKPELDGTECAAGAMAQQAGKPRLAVSLMTKCLSAEHSTRKARADALKIRAKALDDLDDHGGALADTEAAFQLEAPKLAQDFTRYALYLRRSHRLSDSLQAARAAELLDQQAGASTMPTQYHLGWTLFDLGRNQEAIDAFSRGIDKQPDYAFAYWRRGLAFERLANRDRACADFAATAKHIQVDRLPPASVNMLPVIMEKLVSCGLDVDGRPLARQLT